MIAVKKNDALNSAEVVRDKIDRDIIDFAHLGRYTFNDVILEAELLGLFKAQAVQQAELLKKAENKEDWKMAVHTLKGAARGIGANRIGNIAEEIENIGFDALPEHFEGKMVELRREVDICLLKITLFLKAAASS